MKALIIAVALAASGVAGCGDAGKGTGQSALAPAKRLAHADVLDELSGVWSESAIEMVYLSADGPDGVHVVTETKGGYKYTARGKVIGFDPQNNIITISPTAAAEPGTVWSLRRIEVKRPTGEMGFYPMIIGVQGDQRPLPNLLRKLLPSDLKLMADIDAAIRAEVAEKEAKDAAPKDPRCPGVDVSSSLGMVECESAVLAKAEEAMNREFSRAFVFNATSGRASAIEADQQRFKARIDAECSEEAQSKDGLGGSVLTMNMIGCRLTAIQARTKELSEIR